MEHQTIKTSATQLNWLVIVLTTFMPPWLAVPSYLKPATDNISYRWGLRRPLLLLLLILLIDRLLVHWLLLKCRDVWPLV